MPTLALVDDHPLFRAGLRTALALQEGFFVIAEAEDSESALEAVEAARPDVTVVDLALPGLGGIQLVRELLTRGSKTRPLALSAVTGDAEVAEALDAGMAGYASKAQPIAEIVDAILTVASGGRYLAPCFSAAAVDEARRRRAQLRKTEGELRRLTRREREIFDLTVQGLSCEAIGARLSISKRTVDTHRSRILQKLSVHNAMELVQLAVRLGLLEGAAGFQRIG